MTEEGREERIREVLRQFAQSILSDWHGSSLSGAVNKATEELLAIEEDKVFNDRD